MRCPTGPFYYQLNVSMKGKPTKIQARQDGLGTNLKVIFLAK